MRAVVLICLTSFLVCVATRGPEEFQGVHDRCLLRYAEHPLVQRDRIIRELTDRGGRHLIIVRYADDHDVYQEWVYNRADIDGAGLVWAREMTAERNRELIDHFRDRKVWLVEPDQEVIEAVPYSGSL